MEKYKKPIVKAEEKKSKTDKVLNLYDMFRDNEECYEYLQSLIDAGIAIVKTELSASGQESKITITDKKTGEIIFFQDTEGIRNALSPK